MTTSNSVLGAGPLHTYPRMMRQTMEISTCTKSVTVSDRSTQTGKGPS